MNQRRKRGNKIAQNAFDSALELSLDKSGTKDSIALKAHLKEYLDDAKYKDGEIAGLDAFISEKLNGDLRCLKAEQKAGGSPFTNSLKYEGPSKESQIQKQRHLSIQQGERYS